MLFTLITGYTGGMTISQPLVDLRVSSVVMRMCGYDRRNAPKRIHDLK